MMNLLRQVCPAQLGGKLYEELARWLAVYSGPFSMQVADLLLNPVAIGDTRWE